MFNISQDTVLGAGIIILCLMLIIRENWFLGQTRKGQRLIAWFGSARAPWVLRGLLLAGIAFGGLLANGTIRPIRW